MFTVSVKRVVPIEARYAGVSVLVSGRRYASKLPQSYTLPQSIRIWLGFFLHFETIDQLAQNKLFKSALPYYREFQGYVSPKGLNAFPVKTIIDKKGSYINEVRVENNIRDEHAAMAPAGETVPHNHMVMLHGYGSCLGCFYKNADELIKNSPNSKLHILDQLGFGLSSRPKVKLNYDPDTDLTVEWDEETIKDVPKPGHHPSTNKTISSPDSYRIKTSAITEYLPHQKDLVDQVEDYYVESLEKWRKNNGIDKFDLLGHSFGGYTALCYALKYPEHVKKLILVSPGGVERSPFAISNPEYAKIDEEATRKGISQLPAYVEHKTSHWVGDYNFLGRLASVKDTFRTFWRARGSPFAIIRWMGPLGPKAVSENYIRKLTRSGNITDWDEIDRYLQYSYYTSLKPSFSETSLMMIFDSSVLAKYPMLDRIGELKVPETLWIYGEHDYMFPDGGRAAVDLLKKKGGKATFTTVSNAGHNLFMDNNKEFDDKVLNFLKW